MQNTNMCKIGCKSSAITISILYTIIFYLGYANRLMFSAPCIYPCFFNMADIRIAEMTGGEHYKAEIPNLKYTIKPDKHQARLPAAVIEKMNKTQG